MQHGQLARKEQGTARNDKFELQRRRMRSLEGEVSMVNEDFKPNWPGNQISFPVHGHLQDRVRQ